MANATEFTNLDIEHLRQQLKHWVIQRNFQTIHTPKNLMLALVGEIGELAECLQWKSEGQNGKLEFSAHEYVHLGEELSDVLIYLIRLSDECGINLTEAVFRKIKLNSQKYPCNQ